MSKTACATTRARTKNFCQRALVKSRLEAAPGLSPGRGTLDHAAATSLPGSLLLELVAEASKVLSARDVVHNHTIAATTHELIVGFVGQVGALEGKFKLVAPLVGH